MKSALFVCGGWEGHEPEKCARLFAPFLEENGYGVQISTTLDSFLAPFLDAQKMRYPDLIVPIWTMGSITEEQERGLIGAVEGGVRLAGWHGGRADPFRESINYQFMVAGQWVAHPGNIIDYEVNVGATSGQRRGDVVDHEGPVTAGLDDFRMRWQGALAGCARRMRLERYCTRADPSDKALATTTFSSEHVP